MPPLTLAAKARIEARAWHVAVLERPSGQRERGQGSRALALAEDEAPPVEARAVELPARVVQDRDQQPATARVDLGAVRDRGQVDERDELLRARQPVEHDAAQQLRHALLPEHRLRLRHGGGDDVDPARRGDARAARVGHLDADAVAAGRGEAAQRERVRPAVELVRAVAVEVERVAQLLALGVGRAARVERRRLAHEHLRGRVQRGGRLRVRGVARDERLRRRAEQPGGVDAAGRPERGAESARVAAGGRREAAPAREALRRARLQACRPRRSRPGAAPARRPRGLPRRRPARWRHRTRERRALPGPAPRRRSRHPCRSSTSGGTAGLPPHDERAAPGEAGGGDAPRAVDSDGVQLGDSGPRRRASAGRRRRSSSPARPRSRSCASAGACSACPGARRLDPAGEHDAAVGRDGHRLCMRVGAEVGLGDAADAERQVERPGAQEAGDEEDVPRGHRGCAAPSADEQLAVGQRG